MELKPGQKVWIGVRGHEEVVMKLKPVVGKDFFGTFQTDHHRSIEEMSAESGPDA